MGGERQKKTQAFRPGFFKTLDEKSLLSLLLALAAVFAFASGLAVLLAFAFSFAFALGLAGLLTYGRERFEPVVIAGAVIVFSGMVQFALIVFRTSGRARSSAASLPQASATQR